MKNYRLLLLPVFAVAALSLFAQTTTPANTTTKATPSGAAIADPPTPYCDVVIPQVVEQLQKSAEATCKTVSTCVLCLERSANAEVYATMYAQPNSPRCKSVTNISYTTKAQGQAVLDLPFEVLQAPCTKEGVNLSISFPSGSVESANYTYLWTVDDKRAGTGEQVSCACGKSATVTITEKDSKRSVSKTMQLPNTCDTSKN